MFNIFKKRNSNINNSAYGGFVISKNVTKNGKKLGIVIVKKIVFLNLMDGLFIQLMMTMNMLIIQVILKL